MHGASMSGTVIVTAGSPTATTTATTTAMMTATPTTPPAAAAAGLSGRARQHGRVVGGSVRIATDGSTVVGRLFFGNTKVGELLKHGVHAGNFVFKVALNAKGRRLQRKHATLKLTLEIRASAAGAVASVLDKRIALRR